MDPSTDHLRSIIYLFLLSLLLFVDEDVGGRVVIAAAIDRGSICLHPPLPSLELDTFSIQHTCEPKCSWMGKKAAAGYFMNQIPSGLCLAGTSAESILAMEPD